MYNVHIYKGIYSFSCETGLFLLDKCQITLAMKQNQNHFMYQFKKKRKWTQLLRENNIRRRMNKVHLIYNYWVSGLFIPVFVKNRSEIQDPGFTIKKFTIFKVVAVWAFLRTIFWADESHVLWDLPKAPDLHIKSACWWNACARNL